MLNRILIYFIKGSNYFRKGKEISALDSGNRPQWCHRVQWGHSMPKTILPYMQSPGVDQQNKLWRQLASKQNSHIHSSFWTPTFFYPPPQKLLFTTREVACFWEMQYCSFEVSVGIDELFIHPALVMNNQKTASKDNKRFNLQTKNIVSHKSLYHECKLHW